MHRSLLTLTLLTLAGIAVLISLGTWQLRRLEWKTALIERIEARAEAEPVSLEEALRRYGNGDDVAFLRVRASGRFEQHRELHLYAVEDAQPGWRILMPFTTRDGIVLLVDRGFVPDPLKDPRRRPTSPIAADNEVTGQLRLPGRPGVFTPENAPERNEWYWRDVDAMIGKILSPAQRPAAAPFILEADATPSADGWPKAGVSRVRPSNRHFGYALTWFGLALVLAAVYGILAYRFWRRGEFT